MILSYLSPYVNPKIFWPISFFGLAYPILLIILSIFLVYWIVRLKRPLWANLIIIVLGINHLSNHIGTKNVKNSSSDISILTYNTRMLNKYNWIDQKDIDSKIFKLVKKYEADVACFQEFDNSKKDKLEYEYEYTKENFLTVSKFPIIKKDYIQDLEKNIIGTKVDVLIYNDTVSILNIHLVSNWFEEEEYNLINKLEINKKSFFEIISKMKDSYILRSSQAVYLNNHIKAMEHKKIICADLNDTPLSYTYRLITKNFYDSFKESGKGLGISYTKIPLLRIDYILYDEGFVSINYNKDNARYSDHYPIITKLRVIND
jgi:endonuclease/exonuclease/phosphatase family metal-dependent hydrolase